MGFFYDNPIIEFCHKIVRKPENVLVWLFTGMVVGSSLYMILFATLPDDRPDENRRKGYKRL